eukprot:Rhum_TRINITY_DN13045_c1_g1::Rhum_TRINITY_DN13045_c1_g1_i1::g.56058::m.56058
MRSVTTTAAAAAAATTPSHFPPTTATTATSLLLSILLLLHAPARASAQTPSDVATLAFASPSSSPSQPSFFTAAGQTGRHATVGVPVPPIVVVLRAASGAAAPVGHAPVSVVATSSVGGVAHLLGNRAEAVAGVARFDALVFTAAANRPTLTFTAHTAAPYDVRGRTLRTGEVVILAEVVPAWDVRFSAAAPATTAAVHGVPVSPTVSVEAVTSAGAVDAAVQGTVSVRAFAGSSSGGSGSLGTPLGSAALVGGDGAAFFGGVALFPLLALVAPAAPLGPVTLEFTVNAPNHVRLNLRTLRMVVTVSAKGLHRLAFADTGFWPSAGAVRTVRLQAPLGPPAPTLQVLDSAGRPDSSAAVSTPPGRLLVRAAATALPAGTPVALVGAVATVSAGGTAVFPALRTDGYPASPAAAAGWSGGVRFTFTAEESSAGGGASSPSPLDFASVSSGANPLEAAAFSIRFAPDPARSVVTAEGQTKEVVQGQTLGPVVVELLTLAGTVDTATPADAVVVDAFLQEGDGAATPPTLLATAPVAAGTGVASFAALTLPPGAPATLAFRARASAAAAGAGAPPPLAQARGVVLRTGVVTVVPLAAGLRFGPPPSAVTAAGATLVVRQGEDVASITVELLRGDGAVDTATVGAVVEATSSTGQPPVGGTTRATVVNGRAVFAGLRFDQLPPAGAQAAAGATTLVFTLVTPGLAASGASVASGAVTVRGRPHHIGRLSPVPTGAVLGRVVELRIGVFDARGTLVDGAAFAPPPTLSVSGDAGVAATGTWPPGMSQTVRVTLDAPLAGGDVANVVVTPTHPTYAFDPPTLVVRLAVSAADNTVHHASFIDPYNVPTVVRVGEEVPVRVAFFDVAGQPAPNGDAAYAVATEEGAGGGSGGNGLVMLPQTLAARGGIQTLFLRFGGAAPRDAVVRFEGVLPGKTLAPLTRQFRVLPGVAARLEVAIASGTVAQPAPGPVPVVALGDAVVFEAALSDGEGNRVRTAGVVVTVAATVAAAAGGGGGGGSGTVRLVYVDATPTSAEGVARVTARFEGRLPTTTPATTSVAAAVVAAAPAAAGVAASAVLRAEVVAGRARQITATLPAVLVAGVAGGGTVRVLDAYGNAARGADGVLVAATSPAVRTATTSRRGPAELAVWVTAAESPAGVPGPATVLFTPSLAGAVFDPASVAVAVVVKTLQHAVRFSSGSSVAAPSATVGLPIQPVIAVVVVDSDGAPPPAAEPAAVTAQRRTLRVRPSVVPAGAATLAGVDAAGALVGSDGVARFPTLRVATGPASAGQSVQIRFTVEVDGGGGGGGGGAAATPAAVGQSVQTGVLSLTTMAHSMRFATTASLFTREGQPAAARQHAPLAPAVRIEILDSAGNVDTAASSLPASAVVTALSSHDVAGAATSAFLVGRTAPVVRGVATFARLAFKTAPPLPHGSIVFRVEGLTTAAGAVLAARRLTTGAVRVSEAPATLSIPFDPAQPATHRPLGYLVWDSVNAVSVDVLLASGLPATDVPPETQVRVSASVATRASGVPAPTLSGSRFTVFVAPTPGVVTAAAPPPSRATVAFSPAGLAYAFAGGGSVSKEFVMCAGPAAGAVFDAATPSDVPVAPAVAYVSLHLVDAAGRLLKDSWSAGCVAARARATDPAEGAAPVAVAAVASAPAGVIRLVASSAGAGGNGVLSVNGTLRVPLVASEAGRSGVLVTVTLDNTAPGAPATLSRAFGTVEAGPDRVEVTTRPQPVPVASGDAAALDLQFLTADGMPAGASAAAAAAFAVRVEEPATAAGASVASHTQPDGAGRATASLRVTGPPRDLVVRVRAFTGAAADQPLPGASAAVSLRVSHAAAAGGQTASQYYQVFPERAFASAGEFAAAFAERATAVAADAPACPPAEVCRAIAAGNVELVPEQRWPVPPAGNALAAASLPAGTPQAYVFRLARVEATHVARVEAALRAGGAGVPSFPSLRHSATEPPRFLGLLPGLPPPGTPSPQTGVCAAIADAASCAAAAAGCRWDGLACVAAATCGARATEKACEAAGGAAACVWDARTAPARCVDAATLGGGSDGLWIKWGPALLIGAAVLLVCVCATFVLRRCGSRAWWRRKEEKKAAAAEAAAREKQDQEVWRERSGEEGQLRHPAPLLPPAPLPPPPPLHPQASAFATQQQQQQRTRNYVNSSYVAGGPPPPPPPPAQQQPLSPDAHLPEDERLRRALERVDGMIGTMDSRRGGAATTAAANHFPPTQQRLGSHPTRSGGAGAAAAVSGGGGGGAGVADSSAQAQEHAAAYYGGGGGGGSSVRTPSPRRRGGNGEGAMVDEPSPGFYGGESPMSALTVDSDGLVVARQEYAQGW